MSNYIDNLRRIQTLASEKTLQDKLSPKTLALIEKVFQEKILNEEGADNSFVIFYEDVIQDDLEIDFSTILSTQEYNDAASFSTLCLQTASSIRSLPSDIRIGTWILYALKFIDYIVLHYIQEVKNEIPNNELIENDEKNYGEERLRYKMLARYGDDLANVSSWLERLYSFRTRIHHNTKVDKNSNKHILKLENYPQMSNNTVKLYPKILNTFKVKYK